MSRIFRICFMVLLLTGTALAQKTVTLTFNHESCLGEDCSYSITARNVDLRKNEEYTFRLDSINTIAFDVTLFAKSRTIDSKIPEILKGILPGIAGEGAWILMAERERVVGAYPSDSLFVKELIGRYQEFEKQFWVLGAVLAAGKSLTKYIAKHQNDYLSCVNEAQKRKAEVSKILGLSDSPPTAAVAEKIAEIETALLSEYELLNDIVNGNPEVFVDHLDIIHNHGLLERYHAILQANKGLYLKAANLIFTSAEEKQFVEKKHKHDGELTTLHVTVISKVTKDTVLAESFNYFTKGGCDLDFTTGFFGGNVYTSGYYLQTDGDGSKRIVQEDNPRFDLGVGALAHVSYRLSSCMKAGVAAGAYLSTIDGKIRYLLAPSLVLGRMKQVAFNYGWALTKVNRLSGLVSSDGINVDKALPADISAVPMYEKWTDGWFLSLTYNIGRK